MLVCGFGDNQVLWFVDYGYDVVECGFDVGVYYQVVQKVVELFQYFMVVLFDMVVIEQVVIVWVC